MTVVIEIREHTGGARMATTIPTRVPAGSFTTKRKPETITKGI